MADALKILSVLLACWLAVSCGGIVEYAPPAPDATPPADAGADAAPEAGVYDPCEPGQCMGCLGGNPCRPYCYTCMNH